MSARPVLRCAFGPQPDTAAQITLAEAGGEFLVSIRPLPEGEPSLSKFDGYIEARAHARFLRFAYGGKIVDQVDPATKRKAEAAEEARLEAKRYGSR